MNCFLLGTCLLSLAPLAATADNNRLFHWEASLEVGADNTVKSGTKADELSDIYTVFDFEGTAQITEQVSLFSAITIESMTGATSNRAFEDVGLYVTTLGLSFKVRNTTLSIGKINPAFGTAWDTAPGYYGTAFAEDYELSEMLGISAEFTLGSNGGTLVASAFFADNSFLSNSLGNNRGRNTTAAGGAGNTGKLNNFAVQWRNEVGKTNISLGARFQTAGAGGPKNEVGLSAGFTTAINDRFKVIGEVAVFNGFGGTTDKAHFATLGGSYVIGDFTYSASTTLRHTTSAGSDTLFTLGLDYAFENGMEMNAGYAFDRIGGLKAHHVGLALIFPFGG